MTNHDLEAGGPRAGRPKRRHFPAEYKLRIVAEYDAAPTGEKGAILRREGLYDSSIQLWRKQRDTAMIAAVVAALEGHDPQRAASLALRHDTQETRTMDIPYVGRTVLEARPNVEITASQVDGMPASVASVIKAAVAEYETRESPESACAKDADRLDCLFQALEYRASGNGNMRSWIDSSRSGLNTASAKRIADAALHAAPLDWVDQALE